MSIEIKISGKGLETNINKLTGKMTNLLENFISHFEQDPHIWREVFPDMPEDLSRGEMRSIVLACLPNLANRTCLKMQGEGVPHVTRIRIPDFPSADGFVEISWR